MTGERRTITNVVVVQLSRAVCPVCTEGRLPDGRSCPRCHGDGLEPFAPDPTCGHEDCGCEGPLTFIGFADNAEQQPVFECRNGRHTCVHYTVADTSTVAVDDGQIGWAVLELDGGKRRLGGYVSEAVIAGVPCLRIEVPISGGRVCTQVYNAHALYCLTPTSEEVAKIIAAHPEATVEPAPPLERGHAEGRPAVSAPPPDAIQGAGAL